MGLALRQSQDANWGIPAQHQPTLSLCASPHPQVGAAVPADSGESPMMAAVCPSEGLVKDDSVPAAGVAS